MTKISSADVAQLRNETDAAHIKYSEAHAAFTESEKNLAESAAIRSRLVRELDARRRSMSAAKAAAMASAVSGLDHFKDDAAKVASLRNEADILDQALKHFHVFAFMEAQRAQLAAKVAMLERQKVSEDLRLQLHTADLHLSLGPIAARENGVRFEAGGVTLGLRDLVFKIGRQVDEARAALVAHDLETLALRQGESK